MTQKTDSTSTQSANESRSTLQSDKSSINPDDLILRKDRELREHLKSLSLETLQHYIQWCEENGFSTAIKKNWKQRCKEKYAAAQSKIELRRKQLRNEKRRPIDVIRGSSNAATPWAVQIQKLCSDASPATRSAFEAILLRLHQCSSGLYQTDLRYQFNVGNLRLFPGMAYPELERPRNSYLEAIATISSYHSRWIRSLDSWRPKSRNLPKQFSSLCRHLLAKYPTPRFLDCVWFEGKPMQQQRCHDWFLDLSNGTSVRKLGLPIPLSRKMAQHFLDTSAGLPIVSALRRAQVLSVGGRESLLTGLLTTRLATTTDHNEFWLSVIRWLVAHPMLHPLSFGPLVDFFHHQKFEQTDSPTDFTPLGYSPERVLSDMHRWHAGLRKFTVPDDQKLFARIDVDPFSFLDSSNNSQWSINQILTSGGLAEEGRTLRHCVLSYEKLCARGETTIWSMSVIRRNTNRSRKVLTIEVSPNARAIRQVRGRSNRNPRSRETAIIRRWAREQGLRYRG